MKVIIYFRGFSIAQLFKMVPVYTVKETFKFKFYKLKCLNNIKLWVYFVILSLFASSSQQFVAVYASFQL